jgi:hypothetical protein
MKSTLTPLFEKGVSRVQQAKRMKSQRYNVSHILMNFCVIMKNVDFLGISSPLLP